MLDLINSKKPKMVDKGTDTSELENNQIDTKLEKLLNLLEKRTIDLNLQSKQGEASCNAPESKKAYDSISSQKADKSLEVASTSKVNTCKERTSQVEIMKLCLPQAGNDVSSDGSDNTSLFTCDLGTETARQDSTNRYSEVDTLSVPQQNYREISKEAESTCHITEDPPLEIISSKESSHQSEINNICYLQNGFGINYIISDGADSAATPQNCGQSEQGKILYSSSPGSLAIISPNVSFETDASTIETVSQESSVTVSPSNGNPSDLVQSVLELPCENSNVTVEISSAEDMIKVPPNAKVRISSATVRRANMGASNFGNFARRLTQLVYKKSERIDRVWNYNYDNGTKPHISPRRKAAVEKAIFEAVDGKEASKAYIKAANDSIVQGLRNDSRNRIPMKDLTKSFQLNTE